MICQPPFLLSLLSIGTMKVSHINESTFNSTQLTSPISVNQQANIDAEIIFGLGLAISSAFFFAIGTIFLKKLNDLKFDYATILIYPAYVGIPTCLLASIVSSQFALEKRPPELLEDKCALMWQCIYLLLQGISTLLTQFFLIAAVKFEDPAKVSIIRMTDLLITFILQSFILNIYANLFSIIGALLIFISTSLVILYKILYNKYDQKDNKNSSCHKCFFYKL